MTIQVCYVSNSDEGTNRIWTDPLRDNAIDEAPKHIDARGVLIIHSGCDAPAPSIEGQHDEVHLQYSTRVMWAQRGDSKPECGASF